MPGNEEPIANAPAQPHGAVGWHSTVATEFDANYASDAGFRERYSAWLELIERYSGTSRQTLDLGCGSGALLLPLARHNRSVVGIDGSAEMLQLCERKLAHAGLTNATLRRADLAALGTMPLGQFELIVASSVLEYLPDLDNVLATIARLLATDGRFLFSLPNAASLYRRAEPLIYRIFRRPTYYPYVVNVATRSEMQRRLGAAGLRLLETRYIAPTPVLSAMLRPIGLRALADNLALYTCARVS